MTHHKVILNIFMANQLIKAGFEVIEVKPSTRLKGRAAFIFEDNREFQRALREFSYKQK